MCHRIISREGLLADKCGTAGMSSRDKLTQSKRQGSCYSPSRDLERFLAPNNGSPIHCMPLAEVHLYVNILNSQQNTQPGKRFFALEIILKHLFWRGYKPGLTLKYESFISNTFKCLNIKNFKGVLSRLLIQMEAQDQSRYSGPHVRNTKSLGHNAYSKTRSFTIFDTNMQQWKMFLTSTYLHSIHWCPITAFLVAIQPFSTRCPLDSASFNS